MTIQAFVTMLVLTVACVRMSQLMALDSGRPARPWMWMAALTGPLAPAMLALLPRKQNRVGPMFRR